jgi:acetyl esterase/lipase
MRHETIPISKERNVFFSTYLIENSNELHPGLTRPLVVICPGGGYAFLSDREAEPVALTCVAAGYHAVVLRYGIGEHAVMPGPLQDIADTVAYIRSHAKEWFVDPDQIFVCGFSAGAHVAASLGVFWNHGELLPKYRDNLAEVRPNGMILGYPVLDLHSSTTHLDIGIQPGADVHEIAFGQKHPKMPLEKIFVMDEKEGRRFVNFERAMNAYIFGGEYTDEQEDFYSLQNQVDETTPPAFLWHTATDGLILPQNSLQFAAKLDEFGISYELHIYGKGDHGASLGTLLCANDRSQYNPVITGWTELAMNWIGRQSGFTAKLNEKLK